MRGGTPLGTESRLSGGSWGERYLVAESVQLSDEVSGPAVFVDAFVVEVWAEVDETGGRVVEQVPHDDEDGAGDGDQGPLTSPPAHEPSVALAEEGVCPGRGGGDLPEDTVQVGVALAGPARAAALAGLHRAWRELGPRDEVGSGRELGHSQADLGNDHLGSTRPDPWHLVQATDGRQGCAAPDLAG